MLAISHAHVLFSAFVSPSHIAPVSLGCVTPLPTARPFDFFSRSTALRLCSVDPTVAFDAALAGLLADSERLGSMDAAVDARLDQLDETFVPLLGAKVEAATANALDA